MGYESYLDFLAPNDIRVRGTRVGIETILHEFLQGKTAEEIVQRYPSLSLAEVHGTLAYYFDNRDSTEAYLSERLREERMARERQARNPPPGVSRLRAIKHRGTNGSAGHE